MTPEEQRTRIAAPESDTPRTDALDYSNPRPGEVAQLCRTLERDLAAAQAAASENHGMWEHWQAEAVKAQGERDRAIKEAEIAGNAVDALAKACDERTAERDRLRAALECENLPEAIAQSMWGYFQGGSAGSADAYAYFANNKATGGCRYVIERVQSVITHHMKEALAGSVSGWRPIESAPKDGTKIDLWVGGEFPGRHTDCYWGKRSHECGEAGPYCDSDWHSEKPGWVDGTFNEFVCTEGEATHWRPLPAAPERRDG
jgi:predicted secreted protein